MEDLDKLNHNQIILLTLLVSFVTSIATGIVTVTLVNQAPQSVIQPINRIVERTVERVVPGAGEPRTVIKEVPVIVTEEELIIKVINNATPAVVTIYGRPAGETDNRNIGLGFFVSADGLMVAANDDVLLNAGNRVAILDDGSLAAIKQIVASSTAGIALFKATRVDETGKPINNPKPFPALTVTDSLPAIGQTVVAIGSLTNREQSVSVGIVSGLRAATGEEPPSIKTNAATTDNKGGPLLNIQGRLVGMARDQGVALMARTITALIDDLKNQLQ